MSETPARTRERVLAAIRTSAAPLSIEELAESLDIHANTVRFHATGLEEEGLVAVGRQPTGGRGRPRIVYAPTDLGVRSGKRNYQFLATLLLEHLVATSDQPEIAARAAGRAWGAELAAGQTGSGRDLSRVVVDILAELHFEPVPEPRSRPRQVWLNNCPFREAVDAHQQVVCSLHAGMLDGLTAHRAQGVELVPSQGQEACLVRLSSAQ